MPGRNIGLSYGSGFNISGNRFAYHAGAAAGSMPAMASLVP